MITLIGHGYIGKHIQTELWHQDLKHNWISHTDPIPSNTTYIINCAGYTGVPNVDACEYNKQETIEGNVLFPLNLERSTNVPIMHISSGCVYTGYKDGGWLETDTPNFNFDNASFYSATKTLAQAERLLCHRALGQKKLTVIGKEMSSSTPFTSKEIIKSTSG